MDGLKGLYGHNSSYLQKNWHTLLSSYDMNTLFPREPSFPPGFSYYPDFITEAEETELLKTIFEIELHSFHFQGYEAKRRVASFGYDWNFEKRQLSKGKEMPAVFDWLIEKTANHIAIVKNDFAELLVTEYPVGSVINWHRDAPPFNIIAGISLASDCIFRLRPYEKSRQQRGSLISFPVQPRSLYMIRDKARTDWEHSTAPVKAVRYSITLRSLKDQ
jgi:alkylated DNA repair dioxygenase AlkB